MKELFERLHNSTSTGFPIIGAVDLNSNADPTGNACRSDSTTTLRSLLSTDEGQNRFLSFSYCGLNELFNTGLQVNQDVLQRDKFVAQLKKAWGEINQVPFIAEFDLPSIVDIDKFIAGQRWGQVTGDQLIDNLFEHVLGALDKKAGIEPLPFLGFELTLRKERGGIGAFQRSIESTIESL
jgi:hypothetical protein